MSKSRAVRRRRARYAARGLLDPDRTPELNNQRRLPADHPSADPDDGYDNDAAAGEVGIDRREPIFTSPALVRRLHEYVDRTGVVELIDGVLRDHPGEQPVLTTHMLLTTMLLAAKLRGRYMYTVFCEILAGLDASVAVEWGLLDPDTGESALSYQMVARQCGRIEDFLRDGANTADGTRIDLQWMENRFLAPSVPNREAKRNIEIAVDATDCPTWARTTDFTPQAEVDAGRIPDDTVLKPNGKIQRSADRDAGHGYRTQTSSRPGGFFVGYFAHTAVATRTAKPSRGKKAKHASVPPYILGLAVTPADEEASNVGYQVTTAAKQVAANLKVVKADQHYTAKKQTFVRPLRKQGWDIVMNQPAPEIDRIRTITAGRHDTPLHVNCGTSLVEWTPEHLRTPSDGLTGTALQQWFDERAQYQWVVIAQFPNGRKKMICPQCAGNVRSTARTRNPNRANRRKRRTPPPVTAVTDREYCCDGMITLGVEQLDNYQRNAYGTTKWVADYAGRNPVEGVNGMLKDDGSFDPRSCRPFGLAAHTLAVLMGAVIHNLKQTRRTRNPEKDNPSTPARADQATPDTTAASPTQRPGQSTPTRSPP